MANCKSTFESRINKEGKHEVIRITKRSEYVTRRFLLSSKDTISEIRRLGDELVNLGGYWQLDMGGIVTINFPPDSQLTLDELFKTFNFMPTEIVD